jgi:glycosyltransferase involved in cell wall biosynthesis
VDSINYKFGIVIPTRNRPENVRNLLSSIERSTIYPAQCILVDSSDFKYDLLSCSFPLLFVTPNINGQVNQRNYGIRLLNECGNVDYVFLLDDDIVLEPDTIHGALDGIRKFISIDPMFIGFALNITNLVSSNNLNIRLLLYPRQPGLVTKSAFNSSLANLDRDVECDWVLGGAAVWSMDFISKNPNDYPFTGKAYSEDLYYCSKVRYRARFAAICKARCSHIDNYEIRVSKRIEYAAYREGFNDAKIRIHISKSFPQYSVFLTILHMLWVGVVGMGYGMVFFDRAAFFVGVGRVVGLMSSVQIRKFSPNVSK